MWAELFRRAGSAGVNPEGFSLREILWMNEGRQRGEWARAGTIAAATTNAVFGAFCGKSPDFSPMKFIPDGIFDKPKPEPKQTVSIRDVKHLFFPKGI